MVSIFARTDIDAARTLNQHSHLTRAAAFHCQQAVEKILKGAIEAIGKDTPKVHDLERLLALVKESMEIEVNDQMLMRINEVYTESRYPADVGLTPKGVPDTETISGFIEFAERTYRTVRQNTEKETEQASSEENQVLDNKKET